VRINVILERVRAIIVAVENQ